MERVWTEEKTVSPCVRMVFETVCEGGILGAGFSEKR